MVSIGNISGRLRAAVSRRWESQSALARDLGITQGVVQKWIPDRPGGRVVVPSTKHLARICEMSGVSAHWVLTGKEPIEAPGTDHIDGYALGYTAGWEAALEWVTRRAADEHFDIPETAAAAAEALHRASEEGQGKPRRRRKRGSR